jgi:hypothetical protein
VGVSHVGIGGGGGDETSGRPQGAGQGNALRAVADVNGDGLPDLVLSDGALVKVLYNRGGGSFGGEHQYFAGQVVTSLAAVDVNGDGAVDLIVAGGGAPGNTGGVTVLMNAGATGSLGDPRVRPLAATVPTTVTLALCVGGSAPNCPVSGVPSGLTPMSPLSMYYGQVFNGTENVTDSDGSAFNGTGTLDFYQDGVLLCMLAPTGGASCPPSVGMGTVAGSHVFTSVYSGDATYEGSTSNQVTINVLQDTTTTTLTSSANPVSFGQPVTFTATLTGNYAVATGSVTFLNGASVLGMGALNGNGVATFTTSALPAGNDAITASYAGGSAFGPSSASLVQTVYALPVAGSVNFTIAVTPNPVSVGVGLGTLLTVKVTPLAGFTEGVNLSCGNLPTEAACAAASVAPGGGAAGLYLSTAAPHDCGATQPYFYGSNGFYGGGGGPLPLALPAIAGLVMLCVPGRRRWLRGLVAMAAVAAAMQSSGCGNCTDLGTRPATYTIQVMGTASGGTPEVESQSVTLNVTI